MRVGPNQLRAARALLVLHETELALCANVSLTTIRHIEQRDYFGGLPFSEMDALRRTLENAGIEFIERGVRWRGGASGPCLQQDA